MKKVAAFTVAELLVVVVLSLLIASAAFSVIGIFNQQYSSYQKDHEISAELDDLYAWLKWDSYNSTIMGIKAGSLWFEFPDKKIQYKIEKERIERILINTGQVLRTYSIPHNKTITSLLDEGKIEGRIDKAVLSFNFFGKETSLSVHKEYSAKESITNNGN